MNKTDFIRSRIITEKIIHSPWTSSIGGISTYHWIIIGAVIFTITIIVLLVLLRVCKKQGQYEPAMSINIENNQNMANTTPTAPITMLAHTGTKPIETSNHQEKPHSQMDPPSYASLDPDLLTRDPDLLTPEDRIAIRRSWEVKNSQ